MLWTIERFCDEVEEVRAALGLTGAAELDRTEPLYTLDLAELIVPGGQSLLRPLQGSDLPLLTRWRGTYLIETMGAPEGEATEQRALQQSERFIDGGQGRLLEDQGTPVAMCGFNAVVADLVQIGSVFTPPALRSQGHARRAIALHLLEARGAGVRGAVLFAASTAAARTYEAIGFHRIGTYHLLILAAPARIGG